MFVKERYLKFPLIGSSEDPLKSIENQFVYQTDISNFLLPLGVLE